MLQNIDFPMIDHDPLTQKHLDIIKSVFENCLSVEKLPGLGCIVIYNGFSLILHVKQVRSNKILTDGSIEESVNLGGTICIGFTKHFFDGLGFNQNDLEGALNSQLPRLKYGINQFFDHQIKKARHEVTDARNDLLQKEFNFNSLENAKKNFNGL